MLRGENIEFSYDNKEFIKNLNIHIPKGKITTILGPNGSGKSTLLSMLCTFNKPKSGQIYIENTLINNLKCKEIAKKISTVYQHNSTPEDITVENLIGYGRIPHKSYFQKNNKDDENIINWAMEATGLKELKNKYVMNLSGGERQRVFIALALAQKPKILFLDEPTTYLDIFHQIEVLELVKKLNSKYNITVVMVLHDINQAIKYSNKVVVMKNGCIMEQGEPNEVITEQLLK
ncbi:ABC transporter ATP-binding protein, partial [Clostridium tarantellae]